MKVILNKRDQGRLTRMLLGDQRIRPPRIWGKEKQIFKREHRAFTGMHDRVRDGRCPEIQWSRTPEGFLAFINEVGLIPEHLNKPSIGRIDHDKGYVSGNIQWEEFVENSSRKHLRSK